MYKDEVGNNKGDGLVTYFKEESVALATQLLDEDEFRLGSGQKIKITPAVFKERLEKDESLKPKEEGVKKKVDKQDKKKLQHQFRTMEKQLEWFEESKNVKSSKFDKIVILKNMFTLAQLRVCMSSKKLLIES